MKSPKIMVSPLQKSPHRLPLVTLTPAPGAVEATVVDADKFATVLGTPVPYKTSACHPDYPPWKTFKLVVHVTDACPAACKFCRNMSKGAVLDMVKFKDDYQKMNEQVKITEVLFTGGEPMLYWKKVKECLGFIKQSAVIHTMGINLHQIDEPVHVSLSRHHWNHELNEEIIGAKLPKDYLTSYPTKHAMNFACNIIKGYVDNPADMRRVLDLAMDEGVKFVGFIGLLPVNDFCKENGTPPPELVGEDILKYRTFAYEDSCTCANYCYQRDGQVLPFYNRRCLSLGQGAAGRIVYKNGGITSW